MPIPVIGTAPLSSSLNVGFSEFTSLLMPNPAKAFGEDPNRFFRAYTSARGILINKAFLEVSPIDLSKGYYFQFNPQTVSDNKSTTYETRNYAGLAFSDYIWNGGGERIITFQLFIDNTPSSKTKQFRPQSYNSVQANEIRNEGKGYTFDEKTGQITGALGVKTSLGQNLLQNVKELNPIPSKGPQQFEYSGTAFSNSRVDERGVLPEVELIQSFLYPAPIGDDPTPLFSEGGVVSQLQFRPPPTVVFSLGPMYLEGIIRSAPVTYTLFDQDLTPIRATIDIEMAVYEYENVTNLIKK